VVAWAVVTASLALLLAVAAGYLAAHVAFDWLARRYLIVSGAEYLVLGILLGPQVSGLLSETVISNLAPVVTLALGWTGMIVGAQLELRELIMRPAREFRIAFAESSMTFLVVAALEFVALRSPLSDTSAGALIAAVATGAMAVASSGVGIALVADVVGASARVLDQLRMSARIDVVVAIVIFGLMLCVHHAPAPTSRPLTTTEWAVVCAALGVVGGTLFHIFLGDTPDRDRLFVALVGGIVTVTGAAAYLRLSPLLAALFFGVVLVNTTARPAALLETLTRVERPFYFVLLIFGGATWVPSHRSLIAPVLLFLLARAASKIGGSRLAARMNGALGELGEHWGRGLLGQGRIAIAIGLSYVYQEDLPYQNLVFTIAIASMLVTEFLSARIARAAVTAHLDHGEA